MFEIEKNIEMEEIVRRSKKYPFDKMEVGDSFFVPCQPELKASKQASLLGCCRQKRLAGKKFSSRRCDGGFRIWRIE